MKRNPVVRGALWTLGAVLVLLGCLLLWTIRSIIFLIFVSLLLASGIRPVVNWLRKKSFFNRSFAILAVYILIFVVIGLIFYLTLPPLIAEAQDLIKQFSSRESAESAIKNLSNPFLQDIGLRVYNSAGDIAQNLIPVSNALDLGLSVFSSLFAILSVFVITYYWMTEREKVKEFFLSFLPRDKRSRSNEIWNSMEEKMGAWVRGQLVMMLFIGVLAGLGYTVMGVKFALALAVFAGLTELIPLVGPYIGGAPAVLVALTQSVPLALLVAGYLVLLQVVEGNVLVPRVMEKAVGVSPLAVIIGILVGGTVAGIGGALVAVPVAAILQVLYNYTIKANNDQSAPAKSKEIRSPVIKPAKSSKDTPLPE
jgi:predicted PurR-regulated permease PerM